MNKYNFALQKNYLLYLSLIIGAILRFFFIFYGHYISPDGTHYALLGFNLIHHGQYLSGGSQFPDIIQPPLYPLLLGLFSVVVPAELGGKLVSLIFGLLLIAGVYWMVAKISQNHKLAGITAILVSINPALIAVSSQVATESLFIFLLFMTFASILFFIKNESPKVRLYLFWAGISSGLAYLTRPEMIAFIFMVLIILLVWRKSFFSVLTYGVIIGIFVLLYSLFTFSIAGKWYLYPKISFVRVHGQLSRYYLKQDALNGTKTDFNVHLQRLRYSLAPDKKELWANAVFEGKAEVPVVLSKEKNKTKTIKTFIVFASQNLIKAIKKFLWGLILPPGYLLFLLFGVFWFPWRKNKGFVLYTLFFLLPTFNVLLTYVEQRFLYFTGLLLMPLIAYGVLKFVERLSEISKLKSQRSRLLTLAVSLIFVTTIPGYMQTYASTSQKEYYYQAGQWLKERSEKNAKIAATTPQAVYFSGRKYVLLPFARLDSLQLYLREKQVDFILIELKDQKRRLWNWNSQSWPQFLVPVSAKIFNGQKMILLRVKKE